MRPSRSTTWLGLVEVAEVVGALWARLVAQLDEEEGPDTNMAGKGDMQGDIMAWRGGSVRGCYGMDRIREKHGASCKQQRGKAGRRWLPRRATGSTAWRRRG